MSKTEQLRRLLVEAEDKTLSEMWGVRTHQPMPERIGKMTLGVALKQSTLRSCAEKVVKFSHEHLELVKLGEGAEQTAYRRGERVSKILKHNHRYDGMNAEGVAERLQVASDKCGSIMGRHWTPTHYDVKVSKESGERIVTAKQPFIRSVEAYSDVHEIIRGNAPVTEKQTFAEKLQELYDQTGWYADIIGPRNVQQTRSGLQIVDTIPVFPDVQQEVIVADGQLFGACVAENIDRLRSVA